MSKTPLIHFGSSSLRCAPRVVVAIPVKDEAQLLPRCLTALFGQVGTDGLPLPQGSFGVVVFANNCSDASARLAREAAFCAPFAMRVTEVRLPRSVAHAGGARRAAMDEAERWLREIDGDNGRILTTDADSQVAPNWIAETVKAFNQGADAVLGQISLDEEGERLPAALHARGKLESVYQDLLTEISAQLDPEEANPWPHHATISGATFGVTQAIYRRIGGLPLIPLGEDKALVAELRRHDARIRFAPDVKVVTSGRITGRAAGGVADTLRLRSDDPTALCDEALEPCAVAFRRALWRGRLRRGGYRNVAGWGRALQADRALVRDVLRAPTFGRAWELVEARSPQLKRRALFPAELPLEIEQASRVLRRLKALVAAPDDIEPVGGTPVTADSLNALA